MSVSSKERSLLGGALSVEFSECSIAASDLNVSVGEFIGKQKSTRRQVYLINGEGSSTQVLQTDFYPRVKSKFTVENYPTELVLVRPVDQTVTMAERSGFFGRKNEAISVEEIGETLLAVTVGQDAMLPIASFANRTGGNCSYVQLGQEMADDNYFVTVADEQTDRHVLVEALRSLVKADFANDDAFHNAIPKIQSLIDSQAELRQHELNPIYEKQLVNLLLKKLNSNPFIREASTLYPDSEPARTKYATQTIVPPHVVTIGRAIELCVAAPLDKSQKYRQAEIVAFARGEVAVPIARINADNSTLELLTNQQIDREEVIKKLLYYVSGRPNAPTFTEGECYDEDEDEDETRALITYLANERAVKIEGSFKRLPLSESYFEVFEKFFAHPLGQAPNPLSNHHYSNYKKAVLDYLGSGRPDERTLLITKLAESAVQKALGEYIQGEELLLRQVGKLAIADRVLSDTFSDVRFGNTKGDAIISAEAKRDGTTLELRLAGRPASMASEPMKELLRILIDPTKHKMGLPDSLATKAVVEELAETVLQIRSKHQF